MAQGKAFMTEALFEELKELARQKEITVWAATQPKPLTTCSVKSLSVGKFVIIDYIGRIQG